MSLYLYISYQDIIQAEHLLIWMESWEPHFDRSVCAHVCFLYLFLCVYAICVFCAFVFLCICILHISITSAPTYLLIWSHKGPILIALHPPRASLYFHMQWQNRSWRRPAEEVKAYFCLRNISVFVYFVFLYLCISYFFPPDEMEDGGIQLGQWKPVDDFHQQAEAHWELKAVESLWKHQRKLSRKQPRQHLKNRRKQWKGHQKSISVRKL